MKKELVYLINKNNNPPNQRNYPNPKDNEEKIKNWNGNNKIDPIFKIKSNDQFTIATTIKKFVLNLWTMIFTLVIKSKSTKDTRKLSSVSNPVKRNIEQPKSWELTTSLVINIIDDRENKKQTNKQTTTAITPKKNTIGGWY